MQNIEPKRSAARKPESKAKRSAEIWDKIKMVAAIAGVWIGAGLIGYLLMSSPILSALTGLNR